jgi:hypothetical protein
MMNKKYKNKPLDSRILFLDNPYFYIFLRNMPLLF